MKILKRILKALAAVIVVLLVCFIGIIVYAMISDYKPEEKTAVFSSDKPDLINDTAEFSFLTWNIGYCALDKEMDFFYDGGTKVFTPESTFKGNLTAVRGFLKANDTVNFIFIQEIDVKSKRSFRTNEYDSVAVTLEGFNSYFGKNYDVFFVPVPPSSPMGKVLSGLATFSSYRPSMSTRYSFPGEYGFPKQLFMLDRCFLVNRYPLANGHELVIINTHNEAFDPGEIRKAQMSYLKKFMLDEYEKGNYIVAGGDWNQSPPGFKPDFSDNLLNTEQMMMENDYLPSDWSWVYDNTYPTNRTVTASYNPSETTTTVIDFFLLSPNVLKINVETIHLDFENSDHNPVIMKVRLR